MAQYVPARTAEERRGKAIALFSGMAGTLAAARAFTGEKDRRRVLEGARRFFLAAAER